MTGLCWNASLHAGRSLKSSLLAGFDVRLMKPLRWGELATAGTHGDETHGNTHHLSCSGQLDVDLKIPNFLLYTHMQ